MGRQSVSPLSPLKRRYTQAIILDNGTANAGACPSGDTLRRSCWIRTQSYSEEKKSSSSSACLPLLSTTCTVELSPSPPTAAAAATAGAIAGAIAAAIADAITARHTARSRRRRPALTCDGRLRRHLRRRCRWRILRKRICLRSLLVWTLPQKYLKQAFLVIPIRRRVGQPMRGTPFGRRGSSQLSQRGCRYVRRAALQKFRRGLASIQIPVGWSRVGGDGSSDSGGGGRGGAIAFRAGRRRRRRPRLPRLLATHVALHSHRRVVLPPPLRKEVSRHITCLQRCRATHPSCPSRHLLLLR
mmetsp:Transcript_21686/g.48856  ORF Transcript_21686/g.48856 Transcript_21686/m.48856 type:complete len:300 (-) Transcript_21686:175-1074(-)